MYADAPATHLGQLLSPSGAQALALNVTEIELRVMEATNEEPWGPHGQAMQGERCVHQGRMLHLCAQWWCWDYNHRRAADAWHPWK